MIGLIAVPQVIKVIHKNNIFDQPGGRKIHKAITPSLGGVAIYIAFYIAFCAFVEADQLKEFQYFIAGSLLIFFMGIRDDMLPLNPKNKLIVQLLSASMVIGLHSIKLESFYTLDFMGDFPEWFSVIASLFMVIALSNAYNLIDGINGLAGSIAALFFACMGGWFLLIQELGWAVFSLSMLGALLGFLWYNWNPAKIFMGDTGSMVIGFSISIVIIVFLNLNKALSSQHSYFINNSVSLSIALFAYPIFDTLRIFTLRMSQGRSPFSPDKLHVHHMLLRMGLEHHHVTLVILCVSICAIVMAWGLGLVLSDRFVLLWLAISGFVLNAGLNWRVKRVFFERDKRAEHKRNIILRKERQKLLQ
ncbi:MraY family glycosyltransferase [Algivirga pacifica]